MSPDETICAWMKRRRKALDLTQKDLADRVGCSTATIHKIEREERRPSRQVTELIARALEIPIEQQKDFIKVARGEHRTKTLSSLPHPSRVSRGSLASQFPLLQLLGARANSSKSNTCFAKLTAGCSASSGKEASVNLGWL